MYKRIALLICLALLLTDSRAQDIDEAYVEKEFVIILSTPVYEDALRAAKTAAAKLRIKLDLRDLQKNPATGLTWDKKSCENEWDQFPCYVARGRFDDGDFVSIEYSNAYTGFTKGYYIVIVSGAEKESVAVKTALAKAKEFYKDAYSKTTKVYAGCMH